MMTTQCSLRPLTWSMRRLLTKETGSSMSLKKYLHKRNVMTSKELRQIFIDYFRSRDHQYVHSSPVMPRRSDGVYFVNAGMNQFKPIFLGTVDPQSEMASYKRAVNSQKCIRVSGKHNDLDDVGADGSHHTFFEMLGSWSFGDYFKKEACRFAWQLLTEEYKLNPSRLYVTYFGGNTDLQLEPDIECLEIWRELGVHSERILPFGMRDNFWDMGDTGPCGPCTEIHYDHTGGQVSKVKHLVNSGDPRVIELWNLVFMQHERHQDGSLTPLPSHHVDTGMGLERLTAVIQGSLSNYDTDLFSGIFSAIHKGCKCPPYGGRMGSHDVDGVDTGYRIVADHIRMITVAMGDGMVPGRRDLDYRLRQIMHRCFRQARLKLAAPPGFVSSLVPVVIESLGAAFPELCKNTSQMQEAIDVTEERYRQSTQQATLALSHAIQEYGITNTLTGHQLAHLVEGRFGPRLSVDSILDVAQDFGLEVDLESYRDLHQAIQQHPVVTAAKTAANKLTASHVEHLQRLGVERTDDSHKYRFTSEPTQDYAGHHCAVVGLVHGGRFVDSIGCGEEVGVVLDSTDFYSESGGQAGDTGQLHTDTGGVLGVSDVQNTSGYVLHSGWVNKGTLSVGDEVTTELNQHHRHGNMRAHTATHLINLALRRVLCGLTQQGSSITPDRLTFDFTCFKSVISAEELAQISSVVTELVDQSLTVHSRSTPLKSALSLNGLVTLPGEVYPEQVRVVSVGHDPFLENDTSGHLSLELCGGTHVSNTSHIGSVVITKFEGVSQGTKRITAVTGATAHKAVLNAAEIDNELNKLRGLMEAEEERDSWSVMCDRVESCLFEGRILPKIYRDETMKTLEEMKVTRINAQKNTSRQRQLDEALQVILNDSPHKPYVVAHLNFFKVRDVVSLLASGDCDRPILIAAQINNKIQAVCYVPQNQDSLSAEKWMSDICGVVGGTQGRTKVRAGKGKDIRVLVVPAEGQIDLSKVMDTASDIAEGYFTRTQCVVT